MELLMRNLYSFLFAMSLMVILFSGDANAQAVATNSGSGLAATYTTLAAAITALNSASITAPVTITLTGDETAPAGGYSITQLGGTVTNTITIESSGSIITAFTPQVAGQEYDAIFKIIGGDYITIRNFTMRENSANNISDVASNTMTEFGVALFAATVTNGAQNNIIQNNIITLSSATPYQNAIGIFSTCNSSSTNGVMAATSIEGTNSNNKYYNNTISGVAQGFYFIAPEQTATVFESGNDIGGSSLSTGNNITFGKLNLTGDLGFTGYSGTTPAGIYFRNVVGSSAKYNTIASYSTLTLTCAGIIGANGTVPAGITYTTDFSNNTITLTNNGITAISGIDYGSGLSTGTIIGSNNNITINQTSTTDNSAAIVGINASYASATNTCSGNTVTINQTFSPAGTATNSSFVTGITLAGPGMTLTANANNVTINATNSPTAVITSTFMSATTGITLAGVSTTLNCLNNTVLINRASSMSVAATSAMLSANIYGIVATSAATTANIGSAGNGNTITIKEGASATGTSTFTNGVTYINASAASGTLNVVGNILNTTGGTIRSTNNSIFCIVQGSAVTALVNVKNNTINIDKSSASGAIYGMFTSGTPLEVADTISGNSFTFTGLNGTSSVTAIASLGGPANPTANNKHIFNNTINISGTHTGTSIGIQCDYINAGLITYNSVTISSAGATVIGITNTTRGTALTVQGNTLSLTTSAASITSVRGIDIAGGGAHSVSGNIFTAMNATGIVTTVTDFAGITVSGGSGANIFNNTVTNVSVGAATSTANALVDGIVIGSIYGIGAAESINVYKNKIYGITTAATGTTTVVNGIRVTGGTAITVYNNIIGDLTAPAAASTDAIRGISITSNTNWGISNIYYNTVYLNASSTGANFGTTGIYHIMDLSWSYITSVLDLRNNVIVNNSTPVGTGLTVAYRRSSGTIGRLGNYASTSNNNDFYAGTPGASNLIYSDGTSTAQTMSAYTSGVFTAGTIEPRDAASFSENPIFVSTTPTDPTYLHINTTTATQIESGGANIRNYTNDYDGNTRQGNAGYAAQVNGYGTAPDIGADEFDGVGSDQTGPSISYTALGSISSSTNQVLTATITDGTGVATVSGLPTLYYKISPSSSYTAVTGVSIGSNKYTFTFGALATLGGETVSYYIVAQDNAAALNTSCYPSGGVTGFSTNPPAVSTPPTTPSTYSVTLSMSYTSSTVTQEIKYITVYAGATSQRVIGIQVVTTNPGHPLAVTNFAVNATGTSGVTDISNAKIYSTGTSATFAMTTQFGTTVASPTIANMDITGSLTLSTGTNYFWLVYDVNSTAVNANVLDGECTAITIASVAQIPTVTAPAGTRTISNTVIGTVASAQASTANAMLSTTNNAVLRIDLPITGPATGSLLLHSINVTYTGTDANDIAASGVKLFRTTTTTFSTLNELGGAVSLSGGVATFSSLEFNLSASATNYFWVTFDILGTATVLNICDAKVAIGEISIGSGTYPSDAALDPAGSRPFRVALSGNYNIGASQTAPNYTTLSAVVPDLTSVGVSSAVTLTLMNDYNSASEASFPITFTAFPNLSATNTITIKPATGTTQTITGSATATSVISLSGASYVTIDGSNTVGGTTKDLTISNIYTGATATVLFTNAANHNTLKNCIVKGIQTGTTNIGTLSFSASTGNNNNTVQNNDITKGTAGYPAYAINNTGASGYPNTNNLITNNRIFDFGTVGIYLGGYTTTNTYSGNEIYQSTANTASLYGFLLNTITLIGEIINANNIHDLNTSGEAVYGVYLFGNSSMASTISNNLINLGGAAASIYGIYDRNEWSDCYFNLFYNTVYIYGTGTGTNTSACYKRIFNNHTTMDNNVFVNARTFGTGKHYVLSYDAGVISNLSSNYNDFYSTGGTNNVFAVYNHTDYANFATAKPNVAEGANSINIDPAFLYLTALQPSAGNGVLAAGTPVTVTTDYTGAARSVTTPSIGAYENGVVPPTMAYVSSTVTQNTNSTYIGSSNQPVIGLQVVTSGVTSPLLLTSISINTTGTTNLADITNAKIYYTGNTSTFSAIGQFGSTVATPSASFDINGTQALATGINYFWLTYDMSVSAAGGNFIDGECTSITVGSVCTPTVTAPSGAKYILTGALSGSYNVGALQTAPNYTNISSAIYDINTLGVSSAVTLVLMSDYSSEGETFPITINSTPGLTASNNLTIKPNTGATAAISGSVSAGALIKIFRSYVTIDGSNSGSTDRSLTITNTSVTSPNVVLIGSTGTISVTNVTLKNCTITNGINTSTAVIVSDGIVSGTAGRFKNITIQNNLVQKAYVGLYCIATVLS